MTEKTKKRIGILRGGTGKDYHSSLKKGGEAILYISENLADKYKPIDVLVDKDYVWHINGLPVNPSDLMSRIDVVWNFSHPSFSNILASLSIPSIGASSFFYVLENNRDILREHIKQIGVGMPKMLVSPKSAREVFEKFGAPWILKNSNDMKIVKTFNELSEAIDGKDNLNVMVEEFITGKVASVHSVAGFRGENIYIFPLGNTYGIFSAEEKEKLISLPKVLHSHVGAIHYLKADFILDPRGKIYLLRIDSNPDLNPDSHFSQVCISVGSKPHEVIEHILEQALS